MDRSRRATNPDNYNADGTIRKGKKYGRSQIDIRNYSLNIKIVVVSLLKTDISLLMKR